MELSLSLSLTAPRYVGGAGPSWSPAELFANGEQGFWLDPSDPSSMFQDVEGTTPISENQKIALWCDKSGNNNHFSQSNETYRPTLRREAGFWYVDLTGAFLERANSTLYSNSGEATLFGAVFSEPFSGGAIYAEGRAAVASTRYILASRPTNLGDGDRTRLYSQIGPAGDGKNLLSKGSIGDKAIRIFSVIDSAKTVSHRVSGRDQGRTVSYTANFDASDSNRIDSSRIGTATGPSTPTSFWRDRIYSLIGVKAVVADEDIVRAENWLASKSGALSLRAAWGGRNWFTEPTAISLDGNKAIVGAAAGYSSGTYAMVTDSSLPLDGGYAIDQFTQADDHNPPSFLIRASDQRVMAFYTAHDLNNVNWMRISENPLDVTSWQARINLIPMVGGDQFTYPQPVQMDDGAIVLFMRAGPTSGAQRTMCASVSTDDGTTFSPWTQILAGAERPYFRVWQSGGRVDVCCNDGHPGEVPTNSTYHFYLTIEGGEISAFKTDGTTLALPITPATDLPKIWDGAGPDGRSWVWDIMAGEDGHPCILYATFPDGGYTDHRYRRAKWTGTSWEDHEICQAGGYLYSTERFYSGGLCFDYADENVVYCSREIDSVHQIFRYATLNGVTWSGQQFTFGAEKAFRPRQVLGQLSEPRLSYVTGRYTTYINYELRTLLARSDAPA